MWDVPGSGFEPMSPVLAGGFFITEPSVILYHYPSDSIYIFFTQIYSAETIYQNKPLKYAPYTLSAIMHPILLSSKILKQLNRIIIYLESLILPTNVFNYITSRQDVRSWEYKREHSFH